MEDKWYAEIESLVLKQDKRITIVYDPDNILKHPDILNLYFREWEIYEYSGELKLRIKIKRMLSNKKIIVFLKDKNNFPTSLEKKYDLIQISKKDIFKNLSNEVLKSIDLSNLSLAYNIYIFLELHISQGNECKFINELTRTSLKIKLNEKQDEIQEIKSDYNKDSYVCIKKIIDDHIETNKLDFKNLSELVGKANYLSKGRLEYTNAQLDDKFYDYIRMNYNRLSYDRNFDSSPLNSNILKYVTKGKKKIALICFDCMGFSEWNIIKDYLSKKLCLKFNEKASFSSIPSITKYSRLSIFEGKLPIESELRSEEKAFKTYISNLYEITPEEIYFGKSEDINETNFTGFYAVGLIYTFVDKLVHGVKNREMLNINLEIFLKDSNLCVIIESLLKEGFNIYFSSDHGNISCEENGINISKYLVDEKDSRGALYPSRLLAEDLEFEDKIIFEFNDTINGVIVSDRLRRKFGKSGTGLTHGGVTIEEVIVPFIEVKK